MISIKQREAAERGDAIPVALPGSEVEFVIIRRDLVASLVPMLDDSPCDPDELLLLVAESLDPDEDWTVPENHPFAPSRV